MWWLQLPTIVKFYLEADLTGVTLKKTSEEWLLIVKADFFKGGAKVCFIAAPTWYDALFLFATTMKSRSYKVKWKKDTYINKK